MATSDDDPGGHDERVGFGARVAAGYAAAGAAVDLGRGVHDGVVVPEAVVQVSASMLNRHGLIAGATGTGKTVTLQLLAEQLSAIGVPVFTADVKGDLTGLVRPAEPNDRITRRVEELGLHWTPEGSPVTFLSLGGLGPGVPVRATVSSFGPQLLAKVLGANRTQASSLSLVFHHADAAELPLLDLADLRAVLQHLTSDEGKAELQELGGVARSTAGVLLRSITELEHQGAEAFFGEPELEVADLMRTTPDGRGVITCLELGAVRDRPKLFSTFLMWLLGQLFEELPEVGDLDQPKLVFFFDEAHLLFDDASDELRDQIAQTVRLIRSKGVGVFFVTQQPDDVPGEVLAQLGNRVQHALRAFTPRDAKALKATVSTFPRTDDYDLAEALTQLGTGEAMVTILSERGAPTPVVWTRLRPPRSTMAAIDPAEVDELARSSPLWPTYAEEIDRDSARERLAARLAASRDAEPDVPADRADRADERADDAGPRIRVDPPAPRPAPRSRRRSAPAPRRAKDDDTNVVGDYLRSREGRTMVNTVVRGVFGLLRKRR